LDGEVDGGQGGLEGGELGTGEGAIGYDAVDEGLEDGGAEEGAIAEAKEKSVGNTSDGLRGEKRWVIPEDVVGSGRVEEGCV